MHVNNQKETYNEESTYPASTIALSAVDHSEAPDYKYEGEYPDEDTAYYARDHAAESVECDGEDVHDRAHDDDGPHAETADENPPSAIEGPGPRVLAKAETVAGSPGVFWAIVDIRDAIHTG